MRMLSKTFVLAVFAVGAAFLLSGCVFKGKTPDAYQTNLEVWGVFDDSDAYTGIFNEYKKINPHIRTITYRKMPEDTYKQDLINALAAGKGPDIFMIRNSWTEAFSDKIVPAPDTLLTEKQFRDALVDVAADDFIGPDKKIYGVPLSVDSLALYYNKDLFNAAGISTPPSNWDDLAALIPKLNRIDNVGNINQSAVALGTATNINRSTDILSALIYQLTAAKGTMNSDIRLSSDGEDALDFYTQYARVSSPFYSWNPRMHYSLDAFADGNLAMMLNYSWQYAALKQKNAKLNIGVAPLPQLPGSSAPENFANYWGYAVSKNKAADIFGQSAPASPDKNSAIRTSEAWQLLKFLAFAPVNGHVTLVNGSSGATKDFPVAFDPAEKYLDTTMKPAARRDLIAKQQSDLVLAPFASGNLIAKDWPQQDPEAAEAVLADMIESVVSGARTASEALRTAENRLRVLNQ